VQLIADDETVLSDLVVPEFIHSSPARAGVTTRQAGNRTPMSKKLKPKSQFRP